MVLRHVSILRDHPQGCTLLKSLDYLSPTHCTTRVTTHTCYMYCCHNAGVDRRDYKFNVLNFKNP